MKIAIIQISSGLDYKLNLKKIRKHLETTRSQKIFAAFLPECFYSLSDGKGPTPYLVEENNEHYKNIQNLAIEYGIYLLGGSAATKHQSSIINRNYNFTPQGKELNHYDKINLFKLNKSGNSDIDESRIYQQGHQKSLIEIQEMKLGLSICFDLRFPEMYRDYLKQGANCFSISSAFTHFTGSAHWHTLVKARAIENQCFVIATNQCGENHKTVKTYGHSLVVDPWGEILIDAGPREGIHFATLDFKKLEEIRLRMDISQK